MVAILRRCLGSELSLLEGFRPIFAGGCNAAHAVGQGNQDRPAAFAADIKLNNTLLVFAKTETNHFLVELIGKLINGDIVRHVGIGPRFALGE